MFASSMGDNWRTIFGVDYGDLRNDMANHFEDVLNKFKTGVIDANKAAASILDRIGEAVKNAPQSLNQKMQQWKDDAKKRSK